jgi:dihydrofolate synthase / folylpolyglutamate synthase
VAVSVFGADRVLVVPSLADAIAEAVTLAEEQGSLGRDSAAGVLVTGSVVTAGQARAMLVRGG